MPWFKVDDSLPSHPKILAIPRTKRTRAMGLWVLAGAWSAQHLTDGFIPGPLVGELGGTAQDADALVASGLWSRCSRLASKSTKDCTLGFLFEDWADWQPTRAEVKSDRENARERMKELRARRRTGQSPKTPERSPEVQANIPPVRANTSASVRETFATPPFVTPDPTRPDPTNTSSGGGGAAASQRAALVPIDWNDVGSESDDTQTLVAEWIERSDKRPPGQTIARVGKQLKQMLGEGVEPHDLRLGLAAWARKGADPSSLPSFVNEAMNAGPTRSRQQEARDGLFDRAMKRAEALDAREAP